jgi:acyl carrier protein
MGRQDTMNRAEITEKLIEKLKELFADRNVDTDTLEYVDLIDDLGMDSITFISIVVEVEDIFGITVPDDMLLMENFRNVDGITKIIEGEINAVGEYEKE